MARSLGDRMKLRDSIVMVALCLVAAGTLRAQVDDANKQLSHDIFKQLIEINTTDSVGNTTVAAQAMAQRLLDAGFPAQRRPGTRPQSAQRQHGRAAAWDGRAQTAAADLPHRCGRSPARGLVARPLQVHRKGRLLLRPWHGRHQRRRRDSGHDVHSPEAAKATNRIATSSSR